MMIFLAIHLLPVHADEHHPSGVIIDGTLGELERSELTGPDYTIKEEYGERHDSNLFHSFEQFNLHTNETATFTGSEGIQNIISRVTGGNYSWINGTIRSEISDANMYLINPFGVMFGPHASLDIDGSFHVTTADYLTLADDQTFYADPTQKSLLTTSPPSAFGFLDDDCAPITFEGMGEINDLETNVTGLSVNLGETISVIGGDIIIQKGSYFEETIMDDFYYLSNTYHLTGILTAPEGQINLVSVASNGKVIPQDKGFNITCKNYGQINILEKSLLDVSGASAGSIYIYSDNFTLKNSSLYANTYGEKNGSEISINADKNIRLENGARIIADTYGAGDGANINLYANDSVILKGQNDLKDVSMIRTNTGSPGIFLVENNKDYKAEELYSIVSSNIEKYYLEYLNYIDNKTLGKAGDVTIKSLENISSKVNDIRLDDGASIVSITFGGGNAGNITLFGNDLNFGGSHNDNYIYHYYKRNLFFGRYQEEDRKENNGVIATVVEPRSNGGNGGNVEIITDNMSLTDSFWVTSSTTGIGNSGNIRIIAEGDIHLLDAIDRDIWASSIYTSSFAGENTVGGHGGNVYLKANNLTLEDGANIGCGSLANYGDGTGNAGSSEFIIKNKLKLSGVNPHGYSIKYAKGNKYGSSLGAETTRDTSGDGGTIKITAGSLEILNGGTIVANTLGKSNSKNIDIKINKKVEISGSSTITIYKDNNIDYYYEENISGIYAGSESTEFQGGSGGDIHIAADEIILSDRATIKTSTAGGGKAGNIALDIDQLKLSDNASICSTSTSTEHGGAAGTITINATDSVYLNNSTLTTEAIKYNPENIHLNGKIAVSGKNIHLYKSEITTSIQGGTGNGGDIQLNATKAITLNKGIVIANAFKGTGGNIDIKAAQFIQSSDSRVNAFSKDKEGIDGTVNINSSDTYAKPTITDLPENFLDASKLLNNRCEERTSASISRLMILGRDGSPTSPDDWLASPHYLSTSNHHSQDIHKGLEAYNNGNFQDAINYWTPYLSNDSTVDMDVIALIVSAYQAVGHLNKAVDILSDIFPQVTNQSSSYEKAVFFNLVGDLSLCMGDENVLKNRSSQKRMKNYEYLNKGLHEAKLSKQPFILASLLNNMGNALSCSGDYDKAIACYEKSYDICKSLNKECSAFQLRVITQINKGAVTLGRRTNL